MTKAIVFDCFGVLVTDGWLPFKHARFGKDPEKLQRATELNHKVDAGLISYSDFVHEIAQMAGIRDAEFDATIKSFVADPRLPELIRMLKPHYKIGMLSNVAGNWLDTMFAAEDLQLFDAIALSYEMGVSKPDPRAYEIVAERLETSPKQCLLIDDQPLYVDAAEAQGMGGICYRDFDELVAALREHGIDPGESVAK